MRPLAAVLLAASLGVLSAPAQAQIRPNDPRIRIIDFEPDQVVPIRGALGYQLMIEFGPEERIENVSIGDSLAWQVTPNRRANILFLKPMDAAATNMTVVTDLRRYVFDLEVQPKGARTAPPYSLRFAYPTPVVAIPMPPAPKVEAPPTVANSAYSVTGAKEISPIRVFDDGRLTYFEWAQDGSVPAVFATSHEGVESMVNFFARGPYFVVEQVSPGFTLRNGQQVATVINTADPVQPPAKRTRR